MKKRPIPPKKNQAPCDKDILPEQPDLFPNTELIGCFAGTNNPRHLRVLEALLAHPRMREDVDKIAGASNGPQLIDELQGKGLEIPCKRIPKRDRDGKGTHPGQYRFTDNDRRLYLEWKATREATPC
ncbi:MAG: hypothetical protein P4L87_10155 [Formivibrio sp.]|nr:hypothetical protein [Formivibrio sp.]